MGQSPEQWVLLQLVKERAYASLWSNSTWGGGAEEELIRRKDRDGGVYVYKKCSLSSISYDMVRCN